MNIPLSLWAVVMWAWLATVPAWGEGPAGKTMGQPGFLVIDGAADSSGIFNEVFDPDRGLFKLTWKEGSLTLPDSVVLEDWGPFDMGVAFTAALSGTGESGRLLLRDGIYPVTEPVLLTDGRLELAIDSGELEIRGARIIYRRQVSSSREDFRSGLLLLAGMTLLVIVLLRRARLKAAARVGD